MLIAVAYSFFSIERMMDLVCADDLKKIWVYL